MEKHKNAKIWVSHGTSFLQSLPTLTLDLVAKSSQFAIQAPVLVRHLAVEVADLAAAVRSIALVITDGHDVVLVKRSGDKGDERSKGRGLVKGLMASSPSYSSSSTKNTAAVRAAVAMRKEMVARKAFAAAAYERFLRRLDGRVVAASTTSSDGSLSSISVDSQGVVDTLIRQAMSPERLCRMYEGWCSWI
eukprot:CAMPEP_0175079416 /NCGR_PEP_ID=MMETSP0052_2-20121109/24808_1 /TAXON_ID=51329 ORGANISM="Polytomella parva, Strain SAG 63-3" /NCGR_SAMPLE_ID=MMETSP0052_2 /ASSEMBLY_ACC=CAM_ASM_000194 /LENGTH=190 /DNA_ID=CAMNT_0016349739 /DNA_START=122 /DNA_END=694 /DNA_ORIENTATION=+